MESLKDMNSIYSEQISTEWCRLRAESANFTTVASIASPLHERVVTLILPRVCAVDAFI